MGPWYNHLSDHLHRNIERRAPEKAGSGPKDMRLAGAITASMRALTAVCRLFSRTEDPEQAHGRSHSHSRRA
ncbi:MAG: hypothetical protein H6851_18685 [Geminicoccaceae bacterium]|nr:hypothetical protein [Geminicoccaceae bacterium]